MQVIPAIDLRAGRVVRLRQGDFGRQRSYGTDPARVARRWAAHGATRLHLVDLDGAAAGRPIQLGAIARAIAAAGVPCQVGGGIRDVASARAARAAGADRVVLGTALLASDPVTTRLLRVVGAATLVAAIDVRDGRAVGDAWQDGGEGPAGPAVETILDRLAGAGVRRFAVTAIERDGMLEGPDLALLRRARVRLAGAELIASGGVATLDDLAALADLGCDGVIVGRALYEGRFTLPDAIAAAGGTARHRPPDPSSLPVDPTT